MVKANSNSGRMIQELHLRGGLMSVNRRCFPPVTNYKHLISKGYVRTIRTGLRLSRTTQVALTETGQAIATKLFGPAEYA